MMRALVVLPEPPVPFGGAAARWFHVLIRGLVQRGAAVTLVVSSGNDDINAQAQRLHPTVEMQFFGPQQRSLLAKPRSLVKPYSYLYSPEMTAAVRQFCNQPFDLIRFETHFTAWSISHPPAHAELNVHQLYCIDRCGERPTGVVDAIMRRRVASAERSLLRRFQRVSALTPRLAERVKQLHPSATIRVTPMTIDHDLYEYRVKDRIDEQAPTIGLIGTFRWTPTFTAAQHLIDTIWPMFRQIKPGSRLLLVGRGAGDAFGHLHRQHGIEVYGDVESTEDYFRQLDCMVYLPKIGSGMKVKVMEAIAYGVPVITNDEGAEGLPDGVVTLAHDATDVTDSLVSVMKMLADGDTFLARRRQRMIDELSIRRCVDDVINDTIPGCHNKA